jgi:hypothetical protein
MTQTTPMPPHSRELPPVGPAKMRALRLAISLTQTASTTTPDATSHKPDALLDAVSRHRQLSCPAGSNTQTLRSRHVLDLRSFDYRKSGF